MVAGAVRTDPQIRFEQRRDARGNREPPVAIERRNGVPAVRPYQWRARRYPFAEMALARAEAEYGTP
jgi:hypothetical protein